MYKGSASGWENRRKIIALVEKQVREECIIK